MTFTKKQEVFVKVGKVFRFAQMLENSYGKDSVWVQILDMDYQPLELQVSVKVSNIRPM